MAVLGGKLTAKRADCAPLAGKSTLNRLELSRKRRPAITRSAMTRRPSRDCLSICLSMLMRHRRPRSPSTSTPPTIRCTATRKGASPRPLSVSQLSR